MEYVLVSTLLIFVFLGVVQVALVLHARNVLIADAAEGARAAAVRGAQLEDGETACADLVHHSLSSAVNMSGKPCVGSTTAGAAGEPALVRMDVDATIPMTFVPFGTVHLHVSARAVREPR